MKKFNIVYRTVNILNGKEYIGVHSTNDLNDGYLGSGKYLRNAISKYGKEHFKREILFQFDNIELAYLKESEIVTADYLKTALTYNLRIGGYGCKVKQSKKWTDEQKERLKQVRPYTGSNNPNFGNGYKQQGTKNGRHHQNYTGDITEVSKKISNALKKSTKNKQGNNSQAKPFHVVQNGISTNILPGLLKNFCRKYNINHSTLFRTLKSKSPITKTKFNGIGMQLYPGLKNDADKIFDGL